MDLANNSKEGFFCQVVVCLFFSCGLQYLKGILSVQIEKTACYLCMYIYTVICIMDF